jgi:hypothetical protein
MNELAEWIGKRVRVTLNSAVPVVWDGKLLRVSGGGILVEQPQRRLFFPITSVLHVMEVTEAG